MKPKQFFFVLIGVIGVLLAAGGGGYYFALQQVAATSQRLSVQLGEQGAADGQLQELTRVKNQYDREVVPLLPLIEEVLPRTKNQTEILAQLQRIAAESGLNLGAVTFASPQGLPGPTSQTTKSGAVLALPINFQVQGSFAQLQSFLTKVETLNRFTNVTNLVVTRPDKARPIVYTMNVNAYVKP
jgi:Tfp pilus assembly protein PilO